MAWTKIESEGDWTNGKHRAEYMIGTSADINSPPEENNKLLPGSIAYTADLTNMWQKNASGQWVKVGGS